VRVAARGEAAALVAVTVGAVTLMVGTVAAFKFRLRLRRRAVTTMVVGAGAAATMGAVMITVISLRIKSWLP
jgi:hypothetical protein